MFNVAKAIKNHFDSNAFRILRIQLEPLTKALSISAPSANASVQNPVDAKSNAKHLVLWGMSARPTFNRRISVEASNKRRIVTTGRGEHALKRYVGERSRQSPRRQFQATRKIPPHSKSIRHPHLNIRTSTTKPAHQQRPRVTT